MANRALVVPRRGLEASPRINIVVAGEREDRPARTLGGSPKETLLPRARFLACSRKLASWFLRGGVSTKLGTVSFLLFLFKLNRGVSVSARSTNSLHPRERSSIVVSSRYRVIAHIAKRSPFSRSPREESASLLSSVESSIAFGRSYITYRIYSACDAHRSSPRRCPAIRVRDRSK